MEFFKNELFNETLDKFFETWSHCLNVVDFVPKKYLDKIDKKIFRDMKKKIKEVEIYNLLLLKDAGRKLSLFEKLRIYFSGLKPLYLSNKQNKKLTKKKKE